MNFTQAGRLSQHNVVNTELVYFEWSRLRLLYWFYKIAFKYYIITQNYTAFNYNITACRTQHCDIPVYSTTYTEYIIQSAQIYNITLDWGKCDNTIGIYKQHINNRYSAYKPHIWIMCAYLEMLSMCAHLKNSIKVQPSLPKWDQIQNI